MSIGALNIDDDRPTDSGPAGPALSVFQVMPREMYFGASRASSIDLCVRDLVSASRFRTGTKIFAEAVEDHFPGFDIDPLPSPRRGATAARAAHIARAARRERPDMIIVQQHLPTAAAIAAQVPDAKVVLQTHNFQKSYDAESSLWTRIRRAGRRRRYARLAGIIHVSRACAQRFKAAWPEIVAPSCVINNGLDFGLWHPAPHRSAEILCVGRCAPEKGVLEAAQALAALLPRFPDWKARFILSQMDVHPDYSAEVRRILSSLGSQAEIGVQRPFAEVKAAYERAAIAIVPSKWTEPFGRTALEAHAGGGALISSGTGGLAEISGETALMLPSVTPDAIARGVETLIKDPGLRERLAREGAARVRNHFDIKRQAMRLDEFCCSLVYGNVANLVTPAMANGRPDKCG
jgi:glycosyltransferase involved in cell wall biosynthesis